MIKIRMLYAVSGGCLIVKLGASRFCRTSKKIYIPYRTKVWWEKSLAKMCKISIWGIKFGENITIQTIVIEW